MSPFVLLFVTAFGMLAMAIAQLTSQCQFVRFSPGFEADDPISYTARCAKVPGGPFEICSELRLGHCFVNDDGHLGAPVSDDTASFTKSCPSCNVDSAGTAMFCICEALNTSYGYTSIDLG
ncbi:CVNH domain-containing protein [Purpureocillium lavendulum]|uniref:CVNH domain-containing protein n=1 Tax=Purpureocillium lavendulum TaxID=1247861 RepID=A0AB34FKK3_9HYPO|nr:CVNH domain-containing protein [Purpureocillium lavendulum]